MQIKGNIVDIHNREIYCGVLRTRDGRIQSIKRVKGESDVYIMPGFIDAHVHIESSMLTPTEFARMAVVHGTVASVSDPHEIANVLGIEGVQFMIDNGKLSPFKFYFGAPSCVPATVFEHSGAEINAEQIEELLANPDIKYLAEMMNFPGVLSKDKTVMQKIAIAKRMGKVIDGHAPGLRGADARNYISAGISTDHECVSKEEAEEKLNAGMKIIIREGSAAKNFDALIPLLDEYYHDIMFCSDDKHPDDLINGHINQLVSRAYSFGCDLFSILQAACINPVHHYNLDVGLLQEGDAADFIVVKDLDEFIIQSTYINGQEVAKNGQSRLPFTQSPIINQFATEKKKNSDFEIPANGKTIHVIKAIDGEIVTDRLQASCREIDGKAVANLEEDILKITVVNRYKDAPPAMAFINGFGLKEGAIASCVGHDSHNIIAVGCDNDSICKAVNLIIENKGGISAVSQNDAHVLPLPIAGIMTAANGWDVAEQYSTIDAFAKEHLHCVLGSPFMTLSFMALLVIPDLKLSDAGLFSGKDFQFTSLFTD